MGVCRGPAAPAIRVGIRLVSWEWIEARQILAEEGGEALQDIAYTLSLQ